MKVRGLTPAQSNDGRAVGCHQRHACISFTKGGVLAALDKMVEIERRHRKTFTIVYAVNHFLDQIILVGHVDELSVDDGDVLARMARVHHMDFDPFGFETVCAPRPTDATASNEVCAAPGITDIWSARSDGTGSMQSCHRDDETFASCLELPRTIFDSDDLLRRERPRSFPQMRNRLRF